MYPNPATLGTATVRITGGESVGPVLSLYNITGRFLATLPLTLDGTLELGPLRLSAGVYTLRAADSRTARLVVE